MCKRYCPSHPALSRFPFIPSLVLVSRSSRLSAISGAHPALGFRKHGVQHPGQLMFEAPMGLHDPIEPDRVGRQATEVLPMLDGRRLADPAFGPHQSHTAQPSPAAFWIERCQQLGIHRHPAGAFSI